MVSVCLPSDALLQHLPSYWGFSYLGRGKSLHGCSSKVQPLLLALEMNRDHSVVFETASKYYISDSFVDHDGYPISSKGFLPTVVDITTITNT